MKHSNRDTAHALVMTMIITTALFPGCAIRSVYVPLSQNVPLFDTSKQIKASGYLGTNHVELQVAHNPAGKLAVATNVYFGAGIANYDAALGTYGYSRSSKWRYEVFGGYGNNSNADYHGGNIFSAAEKVSYYVSARYHRAYLQPALGFYGRIDMYKIKYSFSASAKLSWLYFNDYLFRQKDEALSTPLNPVYIVNKEYHNKGLFTIEPCLTNKVGLKNVYAILQVQTISPYSQEIDVRDTKFSPVLFFSFGLQYNFTFKVK